MIELNASFLAGFMTAILANCFLAFLIGFFRALIKDRKKTKEVPLRMPKYLDTPLLQTCSKCNGTGVVGEAMCDTCFGRGQAFGAIREAFVPGDCSKCGGTGQVRLIHGSKLVGHAPCSKCNATGKAPEKEAE